MKDISCASRGWEPISLSDAIAMVEAGSRPRGGVRGIADGVPSVGGEHLTSSGGFCFEDVRYVPDDFASKQNRGWIRPGDVLVVKDGATTGKASYVGTDFPYRVAMVNEHVLVCRACDLVLGKFIFFYLISHSGRKGILSDFRGAAQGGISRGFAAKVTLPLAPLAEQRRIVAKIEELFSDLDAGVAALERVKANLKRYRAAVLKAAVEGKLTAEWRKKNPVTESGEQLLKRILAERRKKWEEGQLERFAERGKVPPSGWKGKYQEPESPEVAGLAELPAGWCWVSADWVGTVQLGRQRSPKTRSDRFPTKYIRAANLTESGLALGDVLEMDFRPEEFGRYRLHDGDLILSEASGSPDQVGKPAIWRNQIVACCFQNTVIRLRPWAVEGEYLLVVFKCYYVNRVFSKIAAGVGINHLGAAKFSRIKIAIGPRPEQRQIVAEVERRLSVADAVAVQVDRSLKRAARLRQSILKRAFEGKLVAQDPADEPASVLLERIKAQRAVVPERMLAAKAKPAKHSTQPKRKERELSRNVWLARATIAAYGVQALADQPTFGRVQLQKFLYLAQAHIGLDLQFEFEKQAAGPFDRDIYKVESNAVKRRWFSITGERGDATHYHPGVEIGDRLEWASRMFKKQLPAIDKLIEHLRGMNTDQAELFATIHAVWSELVKGGRPCGEEEIVEGVYAWHESKKRFIPGVIRARIK
jgi:type I restriction enzyme S subunit